MVKFGLICLAIVLCYLLLKSLSASSSREDRKMDIKRKLTPKDKKFMRALALDEAPKGGIKHTIYTQLRAGRDPHDIMLELREKAKKEKWARGSESELLNYIKFVEEQMEWEGKSRRRSKK